MLKNAFAKIINENQIQFPPINGPTGLQINYFTDREQLLKDGYKPFIGSPQPADGKMYSPKYTDNGEEIVQTWIEIIPPQPITPQETPEESREKLYRSITDGWEAELAYKTRKGYPAEELAAIEAKIDEARENIKQMYPDVENGNAG